MTPQEFKSWFEGFTEALTTVPTKAQWTRIKERVAEIDGKPVTERHFIDRYWPHYYHSIPHYYHSIWNGYGAGGGSVKSNQMFFTTTGQNSCSAQNNDSFNSCSAMFALGKSEASQ